MRQTQKLDANGGFAERPDNFCLRLKDDVFGTCACRPSFRAVDGTRTIDIPASFSPRGWFAFLGKVASLGIAGFTIYLGLGTDPRAFWLAYLTNWNVTFSSMYLALSFVNSILPVAAPSVGQTVVNFRVKMTWILFTISANVGILVTLAYWTLIWDGVMNMPTLFPHGILTAFALFDGFIINTIPIRLRHYVEVVLPFAVGYLVWSYLHSLSDIGNPDYTDEDPETNDDLIYTVIDWQNDPQKTTTVALVLVFVFSPILQFLLWVVSGCRRRYVNDNDDATNYVEMRGTSSGADV